MMANWSCTFLLWVFFLCIFHIYNLKNFQDDIVDENIDPKSAPSSIYTKSSGSGSAASSFAAPSVTSGSNSAVILDPLQQIIVDTFEISADLMKREKVADLPVAYAKFLDIQRVIAGVTAMEPELGPTRSPLLQTLQRSTCLDLDISIALTSSSPKSISYQEWKNGWGRKMMHLQRKRFGVINSHLSIISVICLTGRKRRPNIRGSRRFSHLLALRKKLLKGRGKGRPKPRRQGGVARRRLAPANLVRMMTR